MKYTALTATVFHPTRPEPRMCSILPIERLQANGVHANKDRKQRDILATEEEQHQHSPIRGNSLAFQVIQEPKCEGRNEGQGVHLIEIHSVEGRVQDVHESKRHRGEAIAKLVLRDGVNRHYPRPQPDGTGRSGEARREDRSGKAVKEE